jgi:hypothetical protein
MAGSVAQVVVCLPHKCETLISNPSTIKRKRKSVSYHPEINTINISAYYFLNYEGWWLKK